MSKLMKKFLEGYARSSSFIKAITSFFQQETVENPNDKELIFNLQLFCRMANRKSKFVNCTYL